MFAAVAPKFTPTTPVENGATVRTATGREQPANGIVRLPDYLVREPKLPTPEEVRSRRELERYAMDKYLGPENGFDRGVLNLFTFPQLWRKIPLLGQILPCPIPSVTNEERAKSVDAPRATPGPQPCGRSQSSGSQFEPSPR